MFPGLGIFARAFFKPDFQWRYNQYFLDYWKQTINRRSTYKLLLWSQHCSNTKNRLKHNKTENYRPINIPEKHRFKSFKQNIYKLSSVIFQLYLSQSIFSYFRDERVVQHLLLNKCNKLYKMNIKIIQISQYMQKMSLMKCNRSSWQNYLT